ncbi:unnamed protein product, partial [Rotaria magnacalcarata]
RKNGTRSMDLESLFQSRQTISRDITNQAQLYKEQLMELIKEPVQNQSLTNSRFRMFFGYSLDAYYSTEALIDS